ncbi:MAG: hypothetical protein PHD95_04085 [Candidatus ainarchaeum sp.]|nr:hypothetical protein [Candidatus ainarchaeum sp.]
MFGRKKRIERKKPEPKPQAKSPVQITVDSIKQVLSEPNRVKVLLEHKMDSQFLKARDLWLGRLRREYNVSIQEAVQLGFKLPSFIEAGYDAKEFKSIGYSAEKILKESIQWDVRLSCFDLEQRGFSKAEIQQAIKSLS